MRRFFSILILAVALTPFCADADTYVNWNINWTATDLNNNTDFNDAWSVVLYVANDETAIALERVTKEGWVNNNFSTWADFYKQTTINADYLDTSYSFYVNVYDESGNLIFDGTQYNIITYSDLNKFGAISDFVADPGTGIYWMPNLSSPVPEPSSGVLILIGSAVLALRRRRPKERSI